MTWPTGSSMKETTAECNPSPLTLPSQISKILEDYSHLEEDENYKCDLTHLTFRCLLKTYVIPLALASIIFGLTVYLIWDALHSSTTAAQKKMMNDKEL